MAKKARPATNGFDPDAVHNYVARITSLQDDLESERGAYMSRCKAIREDIRVVFSEAKDNGIPVKPFKAVLKARELERRADQQRASLADIDAISAFDLLRHALGDLADTPLGEAAMARDEHPVTPEELGRQGGRLEEAI